MDVTVIISLGQQSYGIPIFVYHIVVVFQEEATEKHFPANMHELAPLPLVTIELNQHNTMTLHDGG